MVRLLGKYGVPFFLAVILLLSACGSEKEEAPPPVVQSEPEPVVEPNGRKVGISLPAENSPFWKKEGEQLDDNFRNLGYETVILYAGNDASKQIGDVRTLLSGNCDLMLVAPVDPETLGTAFQLTEDEMGTSESGTESVPAVMPPVLSMGALINHTNQVKCAVLTNHYQAGVLQAEALISALKLKTSESGQVHNIEILSGDPADPYAGFIFSGAYDTLKPYLDVGVIQIPSGRLTFRDTAVSGGSAENAEAHLASILDEYYDGETKLDAVLGGTDALALGAETALTGHYRSRKDVLLTGSGAGTENLAEIVDGDQLMTVFADPSDMSRAVCDIGVSLMTDEYTDSTIIDRSGWDFKCVYDTTNYSTDTAVMRTFLLNPYEVNASNCQQLLVSSGCYVMDGKYPVPAK